MTSNVFPIIINSSTQQPPAISGGTFPTQLNVGQQGTWTVNASDPQNSRLTYMVDWGDSPPPPKGTAFTASAQQITTFTHSYANPGTYTVKFMVQDDLGLSAQTSSTVNVINTPTTGTSTQTNSNLTSSIWDAVNAWYAAHPQ